MRNVLITLGVLLTLPAALAAQDASTSLPFGVNIGGQDAALTEASAPWAAVADPVAAYAEIVVAAEDEMIIINIFRANEDGSVDSGAQPAIILIQGGNKTTLDKTMDGKALEPGKYLMNVVAGGKTSSILFLIE